MSSMGGVTCEFVRGGAVGCIAESDAATSDAPGRPARVPVRLRMLTTVGLVRRGVRGLGGGPDDVARFDHSYPCEARPDGALFVVLPSGLRLRVQRWQVEIVESVVGMPAGPGDGLEARRAAGVELAGRVVRPG